MENKVVLTGDRPTGPLHLGHYFGSLLSRIKLQEFNQQFIMIADLQALTDNFDNSKQVALNVYELVKDYIASGIDPNKSKIFIQSELPQLCELTVYYMNLVNLGRLQRNPTVKNELSQKGYNNEIPIGFLCYPISQAADITLFKAEVVPVGDDQVPMIEQTNEIVRRFNRTYNTNCLVECKEYLSKSPRLIGIDGKAKASKSLKNAIFLCDSEEVVKQKVFSMYTDPTHLKISDPGNVENNVVFSYLDLVHKDKEELDNLKSYYKKGGLGDSTIKEILTKSLIEFLNPIRQKRLEIKEQYIKDILFENKKIVNRLADQTMEEVREAIGIKYR